MGAVLSAVAVEKSFVAESRRLDILRGVDLVVKPGALAGIVGASGAGKSTLLHVFGGLDKPTSGTVAVNGENIFSLSDDDRSRFRGKNTGFVFQFHHLLPEFTALENIMIPTMIAKANPTTAREKAEGLLESVGLKDRIHHRPGKLSGGEQQRVAIVRALINDPTLFLADEPTGNLDERTAAEVFTMMAELVKKRQIAGVIVTHNMKLAGLLDAVYELHDGRLNAKA
ncbi:MAG: ABC transporter ATP-binding protein [Nitrospinae bacterium]|nr:ABC transporter ATP-binding protein [Nitrospinota bacterium]